MSDAGKRKQGGGAGGEARKKRFFSDVRIFKYYHNFSIHAHFNYWIMRYTV